MNLNHSWRAAAVLIVLGMAALCASPALAGTYTVWSCRGPDGAPIGTAAWVPGSSFAAPGDVDVDDSCAGGGSLRLGLATGHSFLVPVQGTETFTPPPGTTIAGYDVWRRAQVPYPTMDPNVDFVSAIAEHWPDSDVLEYGCQTNGFCSTVGVPSPPLDAANHASAHAAPLASLDLLVGCLLLSGCHQGALATQFDLFRSQIVVDDPDAPQVGALGGSLASATGPVSGSATLVVPATDRGAGVSSVSLAIDGGAPLVSDSDVAGCREPYALAQPCPTVSDRAFSIDTTRLADGPHSVAGTVVDAAGNVTPWGPLQFSVQQPASIVIQDPPQVISEIVQVTQPPAPLPGNGTPASETAQLRWAKPRYEHAAGAATTLTGTLRTPQGAPIAGASLQVRSQELGVDAAKTRTLAPLTTDARGGFRLRVKRDGAQRVSVAFAPHPGAQATATATAVVRAKLKLTSKAKRRRLPADGTLHMTGKLKGAGASAARTPVVIEAVVRGTFRPVGTARLKADGSFSWRYAFHNVTVPTLFSFRAVVEALPGWPWPTIDGARVKVRVAG